MGWIRGKEKQFYCKTRNAGKCALLSLLNQNCVLTGHSTGEKDYDFLIMCASRRRVEDTGETTLRTRQRREMRKREVPARVQNECDYERSREMQQELSRNTNNRERERQGVEGGRETRRRALCRGRRRMQMQM